MKILILTVLAYAAAASAQLGGFGAFGSKVGGKVGSDIGLITGTVIDAVPDAMGINPNPETRPLPLDGPRRRGPSTSGDRSYERRNSGGEYAKNEDYVREKSVYERERGRGNAAGRGWQGRERVRGGSRYNY